MYQPPVQSKLSLGRVFRRYFCGDIEGVRHVLGADAALVRLATEWHQAFLLEEGGCPAVL